MLVTVASDGDVPCITDKRVQHITKRKRARILFAAELLGKNMLPRKILLSQYFPFFLFEAGHELKMPLHREKDKRI